MKSKILPLAILMFALLALALLPGEAGAEGPVGGPEGAPEPPPLASVTALEPPPALPAVPSGPTPSLPDDVRLPSSDRTGVAAASSPAGWICDTIGGCWANVIRDPSYCLVDQAKGGVATGLSYPVYYWRASDYLIASGHAYIWWQWYIWNGRAWVGQGWSAPVRDNVDASYRNAFIANAYVLMDSNVGVVGGQGRAQGPRIDYGARAGLRGNVWYALEYYVALSGIGNDPYRIERRWAQFTNGTTVSYTCGANFPNRAQASDVSASVTAPTPPSQPASNARVYLPFMLAPGGAAVQPTPTPAPTIQLPPTPSQPGTAGNMLNANFEAGRNAGWSETSTRNLPVVMQPPKGIAARSGKYVAWFGGAHNDTSTLSQTLTVPATHPYLSLYLIGISEEEKCNYDRATFWIDEYHVASVNLCKPLNFYSWLRGQINLRPFVGRQVTLRIEMTTDDSLNSSLFLDDLSFESGVILATPSPTRTPAPNNGPIRNPGFELGDNGDWSSWTKSGTRNIYLNDGAHDGKWLAWLGGVNNEDGYIEQSLYIPHDKPYLTYWGWINSAESGCGGDRASFWAGNTELFGYSLCSQYNNTRWGQGWTNFKAYAGTTQKVRIRVQTNGAQLSSLYLDDFAWAASPPSAGVAAEGAASGAASGAAPASNSGQPDSILELAPIEEAESKIPLR